MHGWHPSSNGNEPQSVMRTLGIATGIGYNRPDACRGSTIRHIGHPPADEIGFQKGDMLTQRRERREGGAEKGSFEQKPCLRTGPSSGGETKEAKGEGAGKCTQGEETFRVCGAKIAKEEIASCVSQMGVTMIASSGGL
jgi:hypothetical protein